MQNLTRWLKASIVTHLEAVATGLSLPYFVEGVNEREPGTSEYSHAECRVTGPFIKEVSNDYYMVEVIGNVLLTEHMNITGNAYSIDHWAGAFQNSMLNPIPVYKLGDGVDDDGGLIGCLRPKDSNADAVRVYHFGQLNGTDRVKQSEIDALYTMEVRGATL